jgi:1,2-diacylglycerol-3-alpha-glucose alpha-1,2-galactosyltransferase
MKVNYFVEDMLFFKYIGCATAARSLYQALHRRQNYEISYNGPGSDYDLVHYHTFGPLALFNKLFNSHVSILTAHSTPRTNVNNLAFSKTINSLYPRIYGSFDHIITISESCQNEIAAMLPDIPTTLIPNGVDREFFRHDPQKRKNFRMRFDIPEDQRVVLTVAQQTPRKGIYDMMELAREYPDTIWVWVGGFPYGIFSKEYFRIQHIKKKCGENMIFTGFVPDIIEVYSAADIFFMPSHAETFGLVILEALSSGLPVIARDIPEFREIFGSHLEYFNERAEAGKKISDDSIFDEHARTARDATERFDINRIAEMHDKLYQKLTEN